MKYLQPNFRNLCVVYQYDRFVLHNRVYSILAELGGWGPNKKASDEWIQADLGATSLILKVITQGREDGGQWVTSYNISTSHDGVLWKHLPMTFTANTDMQTKVVNKLPVGTVAQFVRLLPQTWHAHPVLRWEVVGCVGQSKYLTKYII